MPPIAVSLRPSRQQACLLAAAHAVAAGALLASPLPPWALLALLAGVAVSAWHAGRRAPRVTGLRLGPAGTLEIVEEAGDGGTATLLPGSALLGGMIFLAFEVAGRRRHLLLLPDAAPADELRRLRVWLRWQG